MMGLIRMVKKAKTVGTISVVDRTKAVMHSYTDDRPWYWISKRKWYLLQSDYSLQTERMRGTYMLSFFAAAIFTLSFLSH